jgi:hypothetical protein
VARFLTPGSERCASSFSPLLTFRFTPRGCLAVGRLAHGSQLLGGELSWRRLVPQAALTAIGVTLLGAASAIYMPRAIASASAQFGFIGVAFALLSWTFVLALVIVVAAALGATLAEPSRAAGSPSTRDGAPVRL